MMKKELTSPGFEPRSFVEVFKIVQCTIINRSILLGFSEFKIIDRPLTYDEERLRFVCKGGCIH